VKLDTPDKPVRIWRLTDTPIGTPYSPAVKRRVFLRKSGKLACTCPRWSMDTKCIHVLVIEARLLEAPDVLDYWPYESMTRRIEVERVGRKMPEEYRRETDNSNQIRQQWIVRDALPTGRGPETYRVIEYRTNGFGCNCPAWGPFKGCLHVKQVQDHLITWPERAQWTLLLEDRKLDFALVVQPKPPEPDPANMQYTWSVLDRSTLDSSQVALSAPFVCTARRYAGDLLTCSCAQWRQQIACRHTYEIAVHLSRLPTVLDWQATVNNRLINFTLVAQQRNDEVLREEAIARKQRDEQAQRAAQQMEATWAEEQNAMALARKQSEEALAARLKAESRIAARKKPITRIDLIEL
jgi:hypothetical protein